MIERRRSKEDILAELERVNAATLERAQVEALLDIRDAIRDLMIEVKYLTRAAQHRR